MAGGGGVSTQAWGYSIAAQPGDRHAASRTFREEPDALVRTSPERNGVAQVLQGPTMFEMSNNGRFSGKDD
jgi:hypothetical protein